MEHSNLNFSSVFGFVREWFFVSTINAVFFFSLLPTGVRERAARVRGGGYRRNRFGRGVH